MNPYTAERRDVSENTPPEAQEISQGRGFCTPRPKDVFLISALGSVRENTVPRGSIDTYTPGSTECIGYYDL